MHACAAGAQSSQMKEKEGERGREGKNKQKKITKAAIFCKFGHRLQAEECQSGPHPAASAPSASERLGERRGGWRGRFGPEGEGAHGAMWSKGTPLRSAPPAARRGPPGPAVPGGRTPAGTRRAGGRARRGRRCTRPCLHTPGVTHTPVWCPQLCHRVARGAGGGGWVQSLPCAPHTLTATLTPRLCWGHNHSAHRHHSGGWGGLGSVPTAHTA